MPKVISELIEGKILALAAEGVTYRSILKRLQAENIDLTIGTISNVVNRKGKKREATERNEIFKAKRTRTKRTQTVIAAVKGMCTRKSVPTHEVMAKKLNVSTTVINRIIHDDLALKTRKKSSFAG